MLKQIAPRVLNWVPWIALLGTIIGARLWLISGYGSALPIHDQWDGEAAFLFKPWLENTLRWKLQTDDWVDTRRVIEARSGGCIALT